MISVSNGWFLYIEINPNFINDKYLNHKFYDIYISTLSLLKDNLSM